MRVLALKSLTVSAVGWAIYTVELRGLLNPPMEILFLFKISVIMLISAYQSQVGIVMLTAWDFGF